ncbi:hypothetical protein CEP54_005972 [Fusarium duplospermum]|uniref:Uncharacterized protein n=1 Tax=Fusarium duplospermum TaxID=1325734 RepID=A0A428Q9I4_9HYPO|nr:hypothetical protein CEP54_005972 [Fusarium duplospermum]
MNRTLDVWPHNDQLFVAFAPLAVEGAIVLALGYDAMMCWPFQLFNLIAYPKVDQGNPPVLEMSSLL